MHLMLLLLFLPATVAAAGDAADLVVKDHPVLRLLTIRGAAHTRESLVRGEIPLREGDPVGPEDIRKTRRCLEETELFSHVDLRATPAGPGLVDLEVDLADRHGFGSLPEVAATAVIDLAKSRITSRYTNAAGRGVTLGVFYRWHRRQPQLGFELDSVRPFGIGLNVHAGALTSRPTYDLEDDGQDIFTLRSRGGDLRLRRVVSSRTAAEVGFHFRNRTYSIVRPDAPSGRVSALQFGIDRRLVERPRQRFDVALTGMRASSAWGSDLSFTRSLARASYRAWLAPQEAQVPLQPSEIAGQILWGRGGASTPLDEMFAPGAASQMELPLRAHRQKRGGVLGRVPIGRTLALANLDWRQRVWRRGTFQLGTVLFYDFARVGDTARGMPSETLHDLGIGLRVGMRRSLILRGDFAYSPTDGKTALTAGLGHAF